MDIETLNSRFSHAGYVTFKEGPEGFPIALITTPHATAAITPYGAHLLSYTFTSDKNDLLFLSEKAIFKEGTPIRGGVPICWPWFGPDPENLGRSDHGLARNRMWNVVSTYLLKDQECSISFELTDTPETYAIWPHRFRLILKVTVGKSLTMELTTQNRGDTPFEITQALHTYFTVGDITQTKIIGLEDFTYIDKTDESKEKREDTPITIASEIDRIYPTEGGDIIIHDPAMKRQIQIASYGSKSAIVWNPWIRVCEQKADLNSEDYHRMVCIETANAQSDRRMIAPSESHLIRAVYSLADLSY